MGPMRVVVEHPEWGLFLGQGGAQLYWTENALPVAIPEAVTFANVEQAQQFCAGHFFEEFEKLSFHELPIDSDHAPLTALLAAGLSRHTHKLLYFTRPVGQA
jgi:hypothetical protein